jgi:hypothetical protein
MTGPANAVMGDQDSPTELPKSNVMKNFADGDLQMASYAEHSEYKRLREFMQNRAKFYQKYLPDGKQIQNLSKKERDEHWVAACIVIREIENILDSYERIHKAVANARRQDT